jgi:transposase
MAGCFEHPVRGERLDPLGLKFCALIPTAREPDSWGDSQTAANVTRCSTSLIRGAGSMSAVEITPRGLRISQLRAEAARTVDAKQARRILAIAMVLDGHSRRGAARAGGMERQTLRDWVIRSNADGLTGLADRPRPGRQPRLTEAPRCEVAKGVKTALTARPMACWRWADLRARIAAKFDVQLHERSVGKLLKKLNFSSMSVRPLHPQSDLDGRRLLKKLRRAGPRRDPAGACRPAGRNLVSG